jgi:hypothetical protein
MKTEQILNVLRVLVWVVFIGSIVRTVIMAVVLIRTFFFTGSLGSLRDLPTGHSVALLLVTSLALAVMALYVQLWEKMKDLLTEINLGNPFTMDMAQRLQRTSHLLLSIWIVGFIGKSYSHYLSKNLPDVSRLVQTIDSDLTGFDGSSVYLLTAGIVYIVAQVFKRGVELQQENELTI